MQITLTSKEFDEAVSLWLEDQGFTTDRYDISTRVIAGRTDSGAGTRVEVTLDPKSFISTGGIDPSLARIPLGQLSDITSLTAELPTRKFGQGHADE